MKIVVSLPNINDTERLIKVGAKAFMVSNKNYSTKNLTSFEFEEIKEIKKSLNKEELFFVSNIICHNEDIDKFKKLFLFLKEIEIDGIYVADIALIQLAKEIGILDKIIYNPETLITNSYDAKFYLEEGIKAISLAKEITLENILEIRNKVNGKIDIVGHGLVSMYYSKRPIIKNYLDYRETNLDYLGNKNITLEETTRNEKYPIIEDKNGSTIFRSNTISSIKYLKELKKIDYLRIEGVFKSIEYLEYVVKNYSLAIENKLDIKDIENFEQELINKYNDSIDDGFLFKETTYKK